ncbi:hypothetical protein SDC9_71894 [bioreactor metagenome]|uniref:Uncharacterized protein n=1 Tax=bioreactor metagenome TaxID=1076179 RepID=A0A644YA86_9ZZZZ
MEEESNNGDKDESRSWGKGLSQRHGHAVRVGPVKARQRDAQRGGDDHVDGHGEDHRAGALLSQQRHQQRHAHEAGVGECHHQRAKCGIVPADAAAPGQRNRGGHQHQAAQQIHTRHDRVQQLPNRRVRAKAVQHARQREIQHERVEPADGRQRQHLAPRGQIAAQHQGEEGEGDGEDGQHDGSDCRKLYRSVLAER